jgi:hypothetical protein
VSDRVIVSRMITEHAQTDYEAVPAVQLASVMTSAASSRSD